MEGNNKYCENCDKWLDNLEDYEIRPERSDEVGGNYFIKCKSCGTEKSEQWWVSGNYNLNWCNFCKKDTTSKEVWEKNKPNWRKRFVVSHDYYDYEKENKNGIKKINHPCSVKCDASEGCGKQFTYNLGNEELINLLERYGSGYRWCSDCQIKKWEESENEEDKKDLKRLKEITNKNDNRERESKFELRLPSWKQLLIEQSNKSKNLKN